MVRVLILSSFVASSPVGGQAQALWLQAAGIVPVLVPTVLFGRHPGLGAPGGGIVPDALFSGMIDGVLANVGADGFAAVITGYFGSAVQVERATEALDTLAKATPGIIRLVDPILGDAPHGVYVKPEVEHALRDHLVPRATLLTPNAWEAERLTGIPSGTVDGALAAAQALAVPSLITSVRRRGDIGAVWHDGAAAWLASSPETPEDIKGAGDRAAASLLAALLDGKTGGALAERAVAAVTNAAVTVEPLQA